MGNRLKRNLQPVVPSLHMRRSTVLQPDMQPHANVSLHRCRPPFLADSCTARISFTNSPTGEIFEVTVGLRLVTSSACSAAMKIPPAEWTIGQRKRILRQVISEGSHLTHAQEDQEDVERREAMLRARDEVNLAEIPATDDKGEVATEGVSRGQEFCAIRCVV